QTFNLLERPTGTKNYQQQQRIRATPANPHGAHDHRLGHAHTTHRPLHVRASTVRHSNLPQGVSDPGGCRLL
ncbi:uncharacterized protein METZ01_LOCUS499784, partial [marine metagenome]